MKIIDKKTEITNAKIAIVASRYNSFIVDRLVEGAIQLLEENNVSSDDITLVRVPGAFEIPIAIDALAKQETFDGIITLGAVIRGETPHFDYICTECARGVNQVSLDYHLPIAFGVLTVDTTDQALDRSGQEESNKGAEAAATLLEMINVVREIRGE